MKYNKETQEQLLNGSFFKKKFKGQKVPFSFFFSNGSRGKKEEFDNILLHYNIDNYDLDILYKYYGHIVINYFDKRYKNKLIKLKISLKRYMDYNNNPNNFDDEIKRLEREIKETEDKILKFKKKYNV